MPNGLYFARLLCSQSAEGVERQDPLFSSSELFLPPHRWVQIVPNKYFISE